MKDFNKDKGVIADSIALPFWAILLAYAVYKIIHNDQSAWIIVVIIGIAFLVDSSLVAEYLSKKKK